MILTVRLLQNLGLMEGFKIMARNKKGKKKSMLKQLGAKSKVKKNNKIVKIAQTKVTRGELFNIQNTLNARTDTALMGVATLAEILVKHKICSYEDVRIGEKGMLETMTLIRKFMEEAYKTLGRKAKDEDIGTFVYEKVTATKKIDKNLLEHIFGIKLSESRILKPSQVKQIITP